MRVCVILSVLLVHTIEYLTSSSTSHNTYTHHSSLHSTHLCQIQNHLPRASSMASQLTQLIDSEGVFSSTGADAALAAAGVVGDAPYQVVSVIGPQSSGKSTLLNALFGTQFREMVRLRIFCCCLWMRVSVCICVYVCIHSNALQ